MYVNIEIDFGIFGTTWSINESKNSLLLADMFSFTTVLNVIQLLFWNYSDQI